MTLLYSQVLDSPWNTEFVYRAEVTKAPTIRGREVEAEDAPPIMNIILSATLVIAASLRSIIGPDVDDFARVISAQAQTPFNLAIQHVPELVLRAWKAGTDVEGHFIPGYRSTELPRASVKTAENALQSVIARLSLEDDSELDVESQFIIPEENEVGRVETGLILTWKVGKRASLNIRAVKPLKVVSRIKVISTARLQGSKAEVADGDQSMAKTGADASSLLTDPETVGTSSSASQDREASTANTRVKEESKEPDVLSILSSEPEGSADDEEKFKSERKA